MFVASWLGIGLAFAEPPATWTVVMPLGVPQFTHGETRRGVLFGGLQAAAIGATVYAQLRALELSQSDDSGGKEELTWRVVSGASTGLAGLSWLASVIDGSRLHDAALAPSAAGAREWEQVVVRLD